jgi:hypothetical protein
MMKQDKPILSLDTPKIEDTIFDFLELSHEISSLLNKYKHDRKKMISLIKSQNIDFGMKAILISELDALQSSIESSDTDKLETVFNCPSLQNGDIKWH